MFQVRKEMRSHIKKRILLFTDWYEPAFKAGGAIRTCVNFAQHMKDDYEIYIFTGDRDLGETQSYPKIQTNSWIESFGISIFYASPSALNWKNIRTRISEVEPDYIYLHSMYSLYFSIYPLLMKRLGYLTAHIVLAPKGMLKATAMQYKFLKKRIFIQLLKAFQIPKQIIFHASDETEKKDIEERFGSNTHTCQIGEFPSKQKSFSLPLIKKAGDVQIIFIGRIHPIKNLTFLLKCLHLVKKNVVFTIVATLEDKDYWEECQQLIRGLPGNITVAIKIDVPHTEVESLIHASHLFVLPSKGENFGHAIFEALSAGRPVLISDQTPWLNLKEHYAGWDIPLNDEKAFVTAIEQVAEMKTEELQKWCIGAWQYANDYITCSDLKQHYKQLFN